MALSTMAARQTRTEIGEQITKLRFKAGREMPVTRRLTTDELTPYDVLHEVEISDALDEWLRSR